MGAFGGETGSCHADNTAAKLLKINVWFFVTTGLTPENADDSNSGWMEIAAERVQVVDNSTVNVDMSVDCIGRKTGENTAMMNCAL